MTSTTRLHIARLPAAASSFDDQARRLLAELTPAEPVWAVNGMDHAWNLAQFVDLVDAGYGSRDTGYRGARQALGQFVRRNWRDAQCRTLCGRSAYLSSLVEQLLTERAEAGSDEDAQQALAAA